MATKPTETLNFEPSGTAVVAVPSGKQTAGFLPGEKPPAQYLNWLFRTFSRLYNYVKDGQFTGDHTIAGTLGVTGATSVGGALAVTGASTLTGGVANNLLASAGVTVPTAQAVAIQGTSTLSVGGASTFTGGWILPSGAEEKHDVRTIGIAAAGFVPLFSTPSYQPITVSSRTFHGWRLSPGGTPGRMIASIRGVRAGDRIKTVRILQCATTSPAPNGTGGALIVWAENESTGRNNVGGFSTALIPAGAVVSQLFTLGGYTVGATDMMSIEVTDTDTNGGAYLLGAIVTYDRP